MSVESLEVVDKHGAGESIRMLMLVAGEKLGALKKAVEDWLKQEDNDGMSEFHHAVAVGRCIGAAAGLISGDHWIDAQLDTWALIIYEMLQKSYSWYHDSDTTDKEQLKKELINEITHYYLHRFENAVKSNGGHFSTKFSWLDVFFFGIMEVLELYFGIILIDGKFPILLKLIEEVARIPVIQEYITKRRNTALQSKK